MLEVSEALAVVLRHARPLAAVAGPPVPGGVLAESVTADRDSPPFTKSAMDGYAVRATDCGKSGTALRVIEEIAAGDTPTKPVGPGECSRIFTGAPLPDAADAVVMVEKTETLDHGRVRIDEAAVKVGQNIVPRGKEMRAGDVVLDKGSLISPVAVGLLAAVGRTTASQVPAPTVGVLATGNELVEPGSTPGPSQIRNSNGPVITALAVRAGATAAHLGIVRDDPRDLADRIRAGLADSNVLLLAGGVSAGAADLVPGVLADFGVTIHFHKVRLKPGKPLLFGTKDGKLIFGLPGNPVSAFVCFELFVRPAIRAQAGHADPGPRVESLPLAESLTTTNDRLTYHPARLMPDRRVTPLPWFGSADLRALLPADALIVLPPGSVSYPQSQAVDVIRL